ncbi:hypothetical protein ACFWGN_17875 [Oerskovia sp. NPDC060338]|uniref:hypothetical protein n=1 Tax=Oerskovia sp. NPDC060338 TaxID=3347100 RepID=UPI00364CB684
MNLADFVPLAQTGKTVLVIAATHARSRQVFETLAAGNLEQLRRITWTLGDESVRFEAGGSIRFLPASVAWWGAIRGLTPDVVILDADAHLSDRVKLELEPAVATGAAIVRMQLD